MKTLFAALSACLSAGQGAVLCSITASSGSTPRGPGAKMLVPADGDIIGTIGGGAVEYRAQQLARQLLAEKRSDFASYRLSAGEVADIGMICGGDVRVFFQYFDPDRQACMPVLQAVTELLNGTQAAWLVTAIGPDGSWSMGVFDRHGGLRFLPDIPAEAVEPLLEQRGVLAEGDPALYVEPLNRAGTVYLFGAGHVGRELVHVLSRADFRVVVWDERPHAAKKELLPDAAEVRCGPYGGALEELPPLTADDYVVIMTPGHQADYTVLAQVLSTPVRYIGCIGSRRKVAATRERLLSAGFPAAEIDRVYAPIGLPIGGETPAEVAISVAAQMIACRSGRLKGEELSCCKSRI